MNIPCPLFFWTLHPRTSQSTSIWLYTFFFSLISCLCGYAHDMFAIAPITLCVKYMVLHDTCTHDYDIFQLIYGHNAGTLEATLGPRSWWDTKSSDSERPRETREEPLLVAAVLVAILGSSDPMPVDLCNLKWVAFQFWNLKKGATLKNSFSTETVCLDAVQKVEGFTLCRPCPIAVRLMKEGIRVSKAWHCHDSVRGSCSTHRGSSAWSVSHAQKWSPRQTAGGDRTGESLPSLDHDQ